MAPCTADALSDVSSLKQHFLYQRFINLNIYAVNKGLCVHELRRICCFGKSRLSRNYKKKCWCSYYDLASSTSYIIFLVILVLFFSIKLPLFDGMMKNAFGIKCILPNNYVVWEATRPISNCNICSNLKSVLVLQNVTREQFANYAYSHQPIIVKNGARHWPAMVSFSYHFFKDLFLKIEGAFESVDEECQFLNFKSDFKSLEEVFSMDSARVNHDPGTKPWYIGWSNCNREMLKEMRHHYMKPHFLPEDAEHSHVDFVFMGYEEGAFMHLDYISRLMWQAQLQGHKKWYLHPPPECETSCSPFNFTVHPGDILLLDTRQWYHRTWIEPGEFSLTVSSEYG